MIKFYTDKSGKLFVDLEEGQLTQLTKIDIINSSPKLSKKPIVKDAEIGIITSQYRLIMFLMKLSVTTNSELILVGTYDQ